MANLLLLTFLLSDFTLKWDIPKGTVYSAARICVGDTDRDGNYELIFRPNTYGVHSIYYCELYPLGVWQIDSLYSNIWGVIWELGDFDQDGLSDLLVIGGIVVPPSLKFIGVIESPDSFSYPTQEVWRDTLCDTISGGGADDSGYSVFDIDHDGLLEILGGGDGLPHYFWIQENVGDNQYEKVYSTNPDTTLWSLPYSTHACGDFDGDTKIEFAMGALSSHSIDTAYYWIYESSANNTYEKIIQGLLPTKNIKDCFVVADADRDGKIEFVVKGYTILHQPSYTISAFIFEAIGDNTYEILKVFSIPYSSSADYWGGHSDAGDVDGDSVPEIVLEACQDIYIIKSAGNDSFYVWDVLPGNLTGSNVRIFDLDNNGLNEIIISGNNYTRIYEYVSGNIEETVLHSTPKTMFLEISPNPFKLQTNIRYLQHKDKDININVYDSKGSLVRNLLEENFGSGVKTIIWDGKDNVGKQLPYGVYFLRLETSDRSITKKIIKLK
jgi:hypothetical protein